MAADNKKQKDMKDMQSRSDTGQMRKGPAQSTPRDMKHEDMKNLGHKGGKAQGGQNDPLKETNL